MTVVFYDGICGLCNRLVVFLLRRDTGARLRFAPLQSGLAREVLARYGLDPADLDTVYVVADWKEPHERVFARSRAVLYSLTQLGGPWAAAARAASLVPRPLADLVYRGVARTRYRIFGRFAACPLPPPGWRTRFLDDDRSASS